MLEESVIRMRLVLFFQTYRNNQKTWQPKNDYVTKRRVFKQSFDGKHCRVQLPYVGYSLQDSISHRILNRFSVETIDLYSTYWDIGWRSSCFIRLTVWRFQCWAPSWSFQWGRIKQFENHSVLIILDIM